RVNAKLRRFDFIADEPPNYSDSNVAFEEKTRGQDAGLGFGVGLLWKPLPDLGIGAVYRRSPGFNFKYKLDPGPSPTGALIEAQHHGFRFKIPDTYGAGVSYRIADRL